MNPIFYFLIHHYPWWGIPSAFISLEVAAHYKASGKFAIAGFFGLLTMIFLGLAVYYFIDVGQRNYVPAKRSIESAIKE